MTRKSVYALIAMSLCMIGFAGAAHAAYETVTAGATISFDLADGSVDPLSSVTAVAHSDPVVLGTTTANAAGGAHAVFTLPANFPAGNHTLVAQGTKNGKAVSLTVKTFTVPAAASTVTHPLSRTGASNAVPLAATGAGLVAVGAGLIVFVRSRRNTAAPAAA